MAATTATRTQSLVEQYLPQEGTARYVGQAFMVIVGTLLLWASARMSVPFFPVPLTMQTLVVMLIGGTYGMRLGAATLALYLVEGAFGMPVFAGTPEKGIGLAYLMGSTGGYLLAYIGAAGLVGWAVDRGFDRSFFKITAITLAASALILAVGFAWLQTLIGVEKAWAFGVAPFLLGDAFKSVLAAGMIYVSTAKLARK